MSKKEQIIELLEKNTDIDDICTELKVTKSYVYRVQREMDEFQGDNEDSDESKNGDSDDLAVNSTGGAGSPLEGNNENMEKEENKGNTNKPVKVGGVKKRKKTRKKDVQKSTKVNNEQDNSTKKGGIIQWIVNKWKTMLLTLTLLTLLILAILSSFMMKPKEPVMNRPKFPVIH